MHHNVLADQKSPTRSFVPTRAPPRPKNGNTDASVVHKTPRSIGSISNVLTSELLSGRSARSGYAGNQRAGVDSTAAHPECRVWLGVDAPLCEVICLQTSYSRPRAKVLQGRCSANGSRA